MTGGTTALPGATVYVQAVAGGALQHTTTDGQGYYDFDLVAGTYDLRVVAPSGSPFQEAVVNGVVVQGPVTQNIALIEPAGELQLTIRTPAGEAVPRVNFRILTLNGSPVGPDRISDSNGRAVLPLASGTYLFDLWGLAEHSNGLVPANFIIRKYGSVTVSGPTAFDLVLPLVTFSGKVRDHLGQPAANVAVTNRFGYTENGTYLACLGSYFKSDDQGNYRFITLAGSTRTHTLTLIPPEGSGLATTPIMDILLAADRVMDLQLGQPLQIEVLTALPDYTEWALTPYQIVDERNQVMLDRTTDTVGRDALVLAAGTYAFNTFFSSDEVNGPMSSNASLFPVNPPVSLSTDGQVDLIAPIVYLHGHIRTEQGQPVEGVALSYNINFWNEHGSGHVIANSGQFVSDQTGSYRLPVVSGASYDIEVLPPAESGLAPFALIDLAIPADLERDLVIPGKRQLSGLVRLPDGRPSSGVRLDFIPDGSLVPLASSTTDSEGRFQLEIAPGAYGVDVWSTPSQGLLPVPMHLMRILSVQLLEDTEVAWTLPIAMLSGQTTDSNGVPVPGVRLQSTATFYLGFNVVFFILDRLVGAQGEFEFGLPSFSNRLDRYDLAVVPPQASGFAQTPLLALDLDHDLRQNVILGYIDQQPPLILAGPFVTAITAHSALVSWETSEPCSSELHWGRSPGTSQTAIKPGYRTHHQILLGDLTPDTTYDVRAYATDRAGNGPVQSDLVSFRTKILPDTRPPLILTGPVITQVTTHSFTVAWETDEPADSRVDYGLAPQLTDSQFDGELVVHHEQTIEGLQPATLYALRVASRDAVGNGPVVSRVITVWTLELPDTDPPLIIAGPMVIHITDTEATVIWTTNEPATSGVSYNDGSVYGVYHDDTLREDHMVHLVGLTPDTLYHYVVASSDAAGNGPVQSDEDTFHTQPRPDVEPPLIIEGPIVLGITHQSAVIRWETNEPADSQIYFGTRPDELQLFEGRPALVTHHNLPLVGLDKNTLYFFKVCSTDALGNGPTCSAVFSFHTRDRGDVHPPLFTQLPTVIATTSTTATLYWETDEPADAVVYYGQDNNLRLQRADSTRLTRHQLTLAGLTPGQSYGFEASSTDLSGNRASVRSLVKHGGGFRTQAGSALASSWTIGTPAVASLCSNSAMIVWTTDQLADSRVAYETDGASAQVGSIELTQAHQVVLTNLTPATSYQFIVFSRSLEGVTSVPQTLSLTTPATGGTAPPSLLAPPAITPEGTSTATITWQTDAFAGTLIDYGRAPDQLNFKAGLSGLTTDHRVVLGHLLEGTTYYFQVRSSDYLGREVVGPLQSFTTGGFPAQLSGPSVAGGEGGGQLGFVVRLNRAVAESVTVAYASADGSAQAGEDYVAVAGVLVIEPGELEQTVWVDLLDDAAIEVDETFSLLLANATNATLEAGGLSGTIVDDDDLALSFDPALQAFLLGLGQVDGNGDGQISLSEALAVTSLNFNGTGIAHYGGLSAFANLSELAIRGNGLCHLPDLTALTKLRVLDCGDNLCRDLLAEQATFALPAALTQLKADHNSLHALDPHLLALPLRELDLRANFLVELPEPIEQMQTLSKLVLSDNHLLFVPTGIGALNGLVTLELSGNRLRELPPLVLPSLQVLALDHNRLEQLPSLIQLPALRQLDLGFNRLQSIAAVVAQPGLATHAQDRILLDHNMLDDRACPDLVELAARSGASGALVDFAVQGGFARVVPSLSEWGGDSFQMLGAWVLGLSQGQYEAILTCHP